MVVQHNISALNANRSLGLTNKDTATTVERLSSGYRINRATDDAAGLSISEKMRRQIRGLSQASLNAEDGISAVQTAEGALSEVHDILQRMNELAVKAANGTNSVSDRESIQDEVSQLTTELDRISESTKFNEIYLLKGGMGKRAVTLAPRDADLKGQMIGGTRTATFVMQSFKRGDTITIGGKTYTISTDAIGASATVPSGSTVDLSPYVYMGTPITSGSTAVFNGTEYTYLGADPATITLKGTNLQVSASSSHYYTWYKTSALITDAQAGRTSIDDTSFSYHNVGNRLEVTDLLDNLCEIYNPDGTSTGKYLVGGVPVTLDTLDALADSITLGGNVLYNEFCFGKDIATQTNFYEISTTSGNGRLTIEELKKKFRSFTSPVCIENYITYTTSGQVSDNFYYYVPEPKPIDGITAEEAQELIRQELERVNNIGADEKSHVADAYVDDNGFTHYAITLGKVYIKEPLQFSLHVGADSDMTNKIMVELESSSAAALGVHGLNVVDRSGMEATYAIDTIANAISKVSATRSYLGAIQNRLEHTIKNLDNVVENTTASESTIRDTDMATTMVHFSKNSILESVGQSMLAQANQTNQGVLALLG